MDVAVAGYELNRQLVVKNPVQLPPILVRGSDVGRCIL